MSKEEHRKNIDEVVKRMLHSRGHVLSSPSRLAIMLLLVARGPLEFKNIQEALEMTPGNLWSHLKKLESENMVKLRYAFSLKGPRLVVLPTEKGIIVTLNYLRELEDIINAIKQDRTCYAGREQAP